MLMRMRQRLISAAVGGACATLASSVAVAQSTMRVASPDGKNEVSITVMDGGSLRYAISRSGRPVLLPSGLGFDLSFLPAGRSNVAEIYADGPGASWLGNALPIATSRRGVDSTTRLRMVLAPGGGQAIRIRPAR
jgi:hypothetical protein